MKSELWHFVCKHPIVSLFGLDIVCTTVVNLVRTIKGEASTAVPVPDGEVAEEPETNEGEDE